MNLADGAGEHQFSVLRELRKLESVSQENTDSDYSSDSMQKFALKGGNRQWRRKLRGKTRGREGGADAKRR